MAARPQEKRLQGVTMLTREGDNRQPTLSPDGRQLAWLHRPAGGRLFDLRVMTAEGDEARALLPDSVLCQGLCWSEDGLRVLHASTATPLRGRGAPPADLSSYVDLLFEPGLGLHLTTLADGLTTVILDRPGNQADPCYGPGQRIIFTSFDGHRGILWSTGPGGGEADSLLGWPGYLGYARPSPDGRWIVFQAARRTDATGIGLYVCALDGSGPRPLFEAGAHALTPAWLPHEDAVIFASDVTDRDYELYTVRLDGDGLERITWRPGPDLYPCFSRDGRTIVWSSTPGAGEQGLQVLKANWIPRAAGS